jgi:dihydrofolate reductase
MRKVTFGVGNSLDNYIARADGAYDWLMWTDEIAKVSAAYWKRVDTMLMGRKTYELALRQGSGEAIANPYPHLKTYVLSRTLTETRDKQVEIADDAVKLVRKLKRQRGKEICVMGGGELAHSLFTARLIDEVVVNIHPVILGSGIPLFHQMNRQTNLRLLKSKTCKNGCVLLAYGVEK